jgi:hypothetical protein
MMLLVSLLLAAWQNAPQEAVGVPDEIVVLGTKMKSISWDFRFDRRGNLKKCTITRSSGDPELDALVCEATRRCAPHRYKTKSFFSCIDSRKRELLEALVDARVGAVQRK